MIPLSSSGASSVPESRLRRAHASAGPTMSDDTIEAKTIATNIREPITPWSRATAARSTPIEPPGTWAIAIGRRSLAGIRLQRAPSHAPAYLPKMDRPVIEATSPGENESTKSTWRQIPAK